MYKSQLSSAYAATVICKAGKQTLEQTSSGDYVITDGILSDWIVFYSHKPAWSHDGTIKPCAKIIKKLNTLCQGVAP